MYVAGRPVGLTIGEKLLYDPKHMLYDVKTIIRYTGARPKHARIHIIEGRWNPADFQEALARFGYPDSYAGTGSDNERGFHPYILVGTLGDQPLNVTAGWIDRPHVDLANLALISSGSSQ